MDDLFAPPPPPGDPDGAPASDGAAPPPPPPPPPGDSLAGPTPASPSPSYEDSSAQSPQPAAPSPQPGQQTYQPAYDPATQATQAKKSGGKKTLLIVVIGVILLCCCISVSAGVFAIQSGVFEDIATTTGGGPEPGGMSSNDQGIVGEAGTVAVWLSWESGADMDLEIWDSAGESYLTKSYAYTGDDITDGTMGDEYFEFASFSGQDFSSGEYVVSVYYFGGDGPPEVPVTVTVQDVEGRVQTFTKNVQYDPTYDQWHAFRIDATTGYVTPLDEWW